MYLHVNKTACLAGKTVVPGSKSHSIRALFLALLANGKSSISNFLVSEDTQCAMKICQSLAAQLTIKNNRLNIQSTGLPFTSRTTHFFTGNSGISTLFLLPLLGLRQNVVTPVHIHAGAQMQARPIKSLVNALRCLGMSIEYMERENRLPISISGSLKGGITSVDGFTSQYLSALLLSVPCTKNDSEIIVENLRERPYVNMTLTYLDQHKIAYKHLQKKKMDIFYVKGGQHYQPINTTIQGDFSSASSLIAAAALLPGSNITLEGLDIADTQADKALISILQNMGAQIAVNKQHITIKGQHKLRSQRIEAQDFPDLVPTLAVIATQVAGKTEIVNVQHARIKETDRIRAITKELKKMGAKIEEHPDGMTVYQSRLKNASLAGHGDHRTVMALTIAGLLTDGITSVTDAESINKTYPGYIETLKSLGAQVKTSSQADNHIILIGFKHVGKTIIGSQLADMLNKPFADLDKEIANHYATLFCKHLSCRQIMQIHGEMYYRELEQTVLQQILQKPPCIIALGGGTLLNEKNQMLVKTHCLFHVTAPRGIVFERIMVEGLPAFFDPEEDPFTAFTKLWDERYKIYCALANCTIDNSKSIEHAINQAIAFVQNQIVMHHA